MVNRRIDEWFDGRRLVREKSARMHNNGEKKGAPMYPVIPVIYYKRGRSAHLYEIQSNIMQYVFQCIITREAGLPICMRW